jgi:ACT domain-containing protein
MMAPPEEGEVSEERNQEICIVTVTGSDRVGIIAKIAISMAEVNINIVDVNQKIMEEIFVMTMACDIALSTIGMKELRERLAGIAKEMSLEITVQNEAIFKAMHRI